MEVAVKRASQKLKKKSHTHSHTHTHSEDKGLQCTAQGGMKETYKLLGKKKKQNLPYLQRNKNLAGNKYPCCNLNTKRQTSNIYSNLIKSFIILLN